MKVSSEISELFQYIGRYKPVPAVLETKLRPFIPDYIPSVGDIDEFIKVRRPASGFRCGDNPRTQAQCAHPPSPTCRYPVPTASRTSSA